MQHFQQLGYFTPTVPSNYHSLPDPPCLSLHFHKPQHPTISIRAPNPQPMVHCYQTLTLQVTQYACTFGLREKAVACIRLPGEVIPTLLHEYDRVMCREILEYVESVSSQLRAWCGEALTGVYLLEEKGEATHDSYHGYMRVRQLVPGCNNIKHARSRQWSHVGQRQWYYEHRRWVADINSNLPAVEQAQHIVGSSSYGWLLEQIVQGMERQQREREEHRMQMKKELKERITRSIEKGLKLGYRTMRYKMEEWGALAEQERQVKEQQARKRQQEKEANKGKVKYKAVEKQG